MKYFILIVISLLLIFLAAGGLYGGILLLADSSGSALGMTTDFLKNSPFRNYQIPALFLILFFSVLPTITLIGIWFKKTLFFLNKIRVYKEQSWGYNFCIYQGFACLIWINVQQFLTDFFILQPVISACGTLLLIFTLTPVFKKSLSEIR